MQQKIEQELLMDFNLLPVVVFNDKSKWNYKTSQLTEIVIDSNKLVVVLAGLDKESCKKIIDDVQSNLIKEGLSKEKLEDITFVSILENWFKKLEASSDNEKKWFSITHLYYDIIRKRQDLVDKRFTHILWCHDPSKNNIKPLSNACKSSYEDKEKKLLFKTSNDNDAVNFCTYLSGQMFLTPEMIESNSDETYSKVVSCEV
jgi:hypothetical protein